MRQNLAELEVTTSIQTADSTSGSTSNLTTASLHSDHAMLSPRSDLTTIAKHLDHAMLSPRSDLDMFEAINTSYALGDSATLHIVFHLAKFTLRSIRFSS